MTPIFIISLPRSGSTLLQRMLACYEDIETVAEPWILLPHFYALRNRGIYAEYGHDTLSTAVRDFCDKLPDGKDSYYEATRLFASSLYEKSVNTNKKYFIDKTPRYHLIIEDIISTFPKSKIIFLWRNPLAIAASIMETWDEGRWILYLHKIDLFNGLDNMVESYSSFPERIHSVCYETLLTHPEVALKGILNYIGIDFSSENLTAFSNIQLTGTHGDKTGVKAYKELNQAPLDKWKKTMANPIRKAWCWKYLHWIGQERLEVMGYNLSSLQSQLSKMDSSTYMLGSDIGRFFYGFVHSLMDLRLIKHKIEHLPNMHEIHVHI